MNPLSLIIRRLPTRDLRAYLRDPLYRNSAYLALGRFVDVGIGFFFWTVAARLYSVADVGIATALVSSLGLVMAFSRLGFDSTIIRFMPKYDHSRVFNTTLWITTVASIVVSIFFLILIDQMSPEIAFIREYSLLYILFAIFNAITLTTGNALLAFRRADQKFVQNLIMGGRLLLLFPLAILGSLGVFYSVGVAYFLAAIYALLIIRRHINLSLTIDWEFTSTTFRFSFLNYLASLFQAIPTLVMPLLIISLLTPEDAALYYVAFAIGSLVLIIPEAMSTSFFVEGSHGINLRTAAIRSLAVTFAILIPTVLSIFFFGDLLLGLFGNEYIQAFSLLKVIVLSSVFVAIYLLFIPFQNIRFEVRGIVILNFIRFVLLLGLSYIFVIQFGVIGTGYAWAITYAILALGIIWFMRKNAGELEHS